MFVLLTLMVIKNNPHRRANQVAAMVFVFLLIWSSVESITRLGGEGDYERSLTAMRLYSVGILGVTAALVHLSLIFPRIRKVPKSLYPLIYAPSIVIIAVMLFTDLFLDGISYGGMKGWTADYSRYSALYLGPPASLCVASIILFLKTWRESKMDIERNQVAIIIFGLVVTLGVLMVTSVIPIVFDLDTPDIPTTAPLMIFASSIMYSIVKYKMFVIEAVTEDGAGTVEKGELDVEKGFTYLVEEDKVGESYKAFRSLVTTTPGLCLTTAHPDKVRSRRGLGKTPIVWITDSTSDEMTINPWRLDFELSYTIKNFMEENDETVIIIDDLEYLSSVNGFEKLMSFMKNINDLASINNSTIIAPVNPLAFEEESYHMLAGSFDRAMTVSSTPLDRFERIEPCSSYIVNSTRLENVMPPLKDFIKESPALVISKTFPEKFKKKYALEGVKMYWLTDAEHGEEKFISPARLEFELTEVVGEFMLSAEKRTMVLDGLEQLIHVNGFKRTLDYLKNVEDRVSMNRGVLFVTVEWKSLKDNEIAILEKKFDYVIH